jgi:hypothetical protein
MLQDEEIVARVRTSLERGTSSSIRKTLHPVSYSLPRSERWRLRQLLTPHIIAVLRDGLRGASAYRLNQALSVLRWAPSLDKLFDGWTLEDWHKTIETSSVNSLRLFTYSLNMWGLVGATRALASALPSSNLNLLLAPSRCYLNEKGLGGLIGNLGQVLGEVKLEPFFEAVAKLDLAPLLACSDPRNISWLLSRILKLQRPDLVSAFAESNFVAIGDASRRAEAMDRLWLLWNVAAGAKLLGAALMEDSGGAKGLPDRGDAAYLPMLGLRCYLGLADNVEISNLEQVVARVAAEESPTLVGLYLYAMSCDTSLEKLSDYKEKLRLAYWRMRIESTPVAAVRELLTTALKRLEGRL